MYVTTHTVKFGGRYYPPGAEIKLTANEAAPLLDAGAITRKLVAAKAEDDKAKGATGAAGDGAGSAKK